MKTSLKALRSTAKRARSEASSSIKDSNLYLGATETPSLACSKNLDSPKVFIIGATKDSSTKSKILWKIIFLVSKTLLIERYGAAHSSSIQPRESTKHACLFTNPLVKKVLLFSETFSLTTTKP